MNKCEAVGCQSEVDAGRFMCDRHWRMLPLTLQEKVFEHLRPEGAVVLAGGALTAAHKARLYIKREENRRREYADG